MDYILKLESKIIKGVRNMSNYLTFFRFNKENNKEFLNITPVRSKIIPTILISLLLISFPLTLFSIPTYGQHIENDYETILTDVLGFNHISLSSVETFPPGKYVAILYAELAGYSETNLLRYYPVLTYNNYSIIFPGPVGAEYGSDGYLDQPYPFKIFEVQDEFGLSLLASEDFYTEFWRNEDSEHHSKIYENLDVPNMYLIGFEDKLGGDDRDFNDMVLSLTQILSPKIVSVTRSPLDPRANQQVTITAQVIEGEAEIKSVILSYQIGSSSWTNVTMNQNGEYYAAPIPGQPTNTQVKYKIYATDVDNNSDISTLESYSVIILNSSPIAVMTYSPSVTFTDEVVQFDASSSYDPDGTIESYSWDFGDGNTATGANVIHSYEENGEYAITLTVTDNEGLVSGKTGIQLVKNRPPVAVISVSEPVMTNESVLFDASSSYDSDGTIISYTWSFGDGTATEGVTATHSYTNSGVYSVILAVEDNDGASNQKKLTIYVTEETSSDETNKRPVASFTAVPRIVTVGETVSFDASESFDSDGSIASYSWDFGDSNTGSGVTVNHSFNKQGTYTITLTVTDNNGKIDIDANAVSVTVQATPNLNPVAAFNKSTQNAVRGETIYFDATQSYDTDGLIVSYAWDFGDGTTSTEMEVDHTYTDIGIYTVTLTITDNDGVKSKTTSAITISNESPMASFTKSAETIKVDEIISFDASESFDPDGSIASYSWDFGDGNTATGLTAENTYMEQGTYIVTLIVTDNTGDSSMITANITVEAEPGLPLLSIIGIAIAAVAALIIILILARRRSA
jgi:PKD repeat protein